MLLLVVGLIAAPFILPQSMMDRLLSIGNMGDSSTSYRVNIWMGTLNMLEHFWLTGVGLGAAAFAKVYPFYSFSMITAPHAHNIYLETMAEMGIVGLGLLISIVGAFIFEILRFFVRSKEKTRQSVIVIAFLAGMMGFMLQGVFDYVWYNYRVFLLFWIFLGIGSKICEVDE
jgi:O-antigen ligase